MEAIYNAILLIPQSPKQATRLLCQIARTQPNFIRLLKTMAIQLYDRFAPHSQKEHFQYQATCKQMLAILNRFISVSFQQKQNDVYLQIENYYQWIIQIFLCDNISLTCKKILSPSFKKVLESICYKPLRINEFIEHMMNNSMNSASSVFIYLGCLLDSSLDNTAKFQSIAQSYLFLYHAINVQYKSLIDFYKNQHMECDGVSEFPIFLRKLKENDFMLSQLHNMFKLILSLFKTSKHYKDLEATSYKIFFNPDLAQYISSILRIQQDLLDTKQKENRYGLKFIIITSMKNEQKDVINQQKSLCLQILTIIYTLTDKEFNLMYTDKLLMKQLCNLADLIINQLIICSQEGVLQNISIQLEITDVIASMFGLLSAMVLFKDLRPFFQSLNVEKIIRLAFFYTKAFQQQLSIYQNSPQEYFHFNYYICDDPLNQQQIDNQIDEFKYFSIKRKAVNFIKQMNQKMEGFHSIMMDICCDYIELWIQQKLHYKQQNRQIFLERYVLRRDIFSCFSMESSLFIFTILLQHSWEQHQKLKRMYFLLNKVRLSFFNNLELYRLYICLSVNHNLFILHNGHKNHYNFIQKVYKLDNKQCCTTQAGYFFIEKLIGNHKEDEDYCVFVEKILHEISEQFEIALSLYPFQTINNVIKVEFIQQNIVGLQWICKSLFILNKRILHFIESKSIKDDLLIIILKVYHNLMKCAGKKIKENRQLPYPQFESQKANYESQISSLFSFTLFSYLDKLIKDQKEIQESESILQHLSTIFLQVLAQSIQIGEDKIDMVLNYTLNLLKIHSQCEQSIKQKAFELLYQLVNIRLFTFDQTIHNTILAWMKSIYYQSQVSLSQVCIILQLLYYFIEGNPHQNQYNFLIFYSSIIQILEKKFLQHLFQYHNYYQALQEEIDSNIKRINELRIDFDPSVKVKTNPVTIIRLYNTILLNPYFDITIVQKTHDMIKKYNFQIIPTYDLTLQVLALQSLIKRNSNLSVIQCFRFTTQLLGYNCKEHTVMNKQQNQIQAKISNLTSSLKSSLTVTDPYQTYANLVKKHVFRPQLVNRSYISNRADEIQISIVDFLQSDKYLMNLVKKLTLTRNVNSKTRMIVKIRKDVNDEFV